MAAPTIIQLLRTYFTSDFYSRAAELLDENTYKTEKAVAAAIIPLIAGSMLREATASTESNLNLFKLCTEAEENFASEYDYTILEKQNGPADLPLKEDILPRISDYAGIRTDSVARLITLASLSAYGLIGKHIRRNQLSPGGLAGYLSSQEDVIADALPASLLFLKDSLDIANVFSVKKKWDYSSRKYPSLAWKRGRRILIAGVFILLLIVLYVLFIR